MPETLFENEYVRIERDQFRGLSGSIVVTDKTLAHLTDRKRADLKDSDGNLVCETETVMVAPGAVDVAVYVYPDNEDGRMMAKDVSGQISRSRDKESKGCTGR